MPGPYGPGHRYLGEFTSASNANARLVVLGMGAASGMTYFDTSIDENMQWDATRGLWVSSQRYELNFGTRGQRATGQYLFVMGDTSTGGGVAAGVPIESCVLVGIMLSKTSSAASAIDIRREGVDLIAAYALPAGSALHVDNTLATALLTGRIGVRVSSSGSTTRNCHIRLFYRRTA